VISAIVSSGDPAEQARRFIERLEAGKVTPDA